MKKVLIALMVLVATVSLMAGAFAEEYEVVAQITTTSEEAVDTSIVPEIPDGTLSAEVFGFDSGKVYAVYSAPDVKSIRGADGKSKVSKTTGYKSSGAKATGLWFSMMSKRAFTGSAIFLQRLSPLECQLTI